MRDWCSECKKYHSVGDVDHCRGCHKEKPRSEFPFWGLKYPDGRIETRWRTRYCKGKCFDRRYGELMGKKTPGAIAAPVCVYG